MDADFSVELAHDDPVLDFPWTDPDDKLSYFDVKRHPDLIAKIVEAENFPELAAFLRTLNSGRSAVESAKCDVWATTDLTAEEEIYGASHKFASYVDLVFSNDGRRRSFPIHEDFARCLTDLLRRAPEVAASVETCLRRCFFGGATEAQEGFYFTVYISGYANDEATARRNWSMALTAAANALARLSLQDE
jgi:hypothetical protein